MSNTNPMTHAADAISAGAIVGVFLGYLPAIAAVAGFLWYCIQIWESRTIQHWWRNRQMKRRAKKIARLRAREKVIIAELDALNVVRAARVEAREKVETAKVEAAKEAAHAAVETQEELPPI